MAALQETGALLIFRVGPVQCCAPSAPVSGIVIPPKLTRMPGSRAAEPGIFRHGGHVVRVVDLRERFGIDADERDPVGRMVIVQLRDGQVGFWVDAIGDVVSMPTQGWSKLPPQIPREIFSRALIFKGQITLYTDFERIRGLHEEHLRAHIAQLKQEQERAKAREATAKPVPRATQRAEVPQGRRPVESTPPATPAKPEVPTPLPTQKRSFPANPKPPPPNTAEPDVRRQSDALPPRPVVAARAATPTVTARKTETPSAPPPSSQPPPPRPIPAPIREPAPTIASTVADTTPAASHREPEAPPATAAPARWPLWAALLLVVGCVGWLAFVLLKDVVPQRVDRPLPAAEQAPPRVSEPVAAVVPPPVRALPAVENPPEPEPAAAPPPRVESAAREPATPAPAAEAVAPAVASAVPAEPEIVTELPPPAAAATVTISRDSEGLVIEIKDQAPVTTEPETPDAAQEEGAVPAEPAASSENEHLTIATAENAGSQPEAETKQSAEPLPAAVPASASESTAVAASPAVTVPPSAGPPPSAAPKPHRRVMVVHTVVKGDTLWHIAIRYLGDPFRYPELARLSRIPNPDLIYPGDKVKIIRTME